MTNITFTNFDKLEREPFADKLTTAISKFYVLEKEAYVLSLNAKYGSGKTTFLNMWKHELESQKYKVIYINAWESDFDDEPIVPIISALLDTIESKNGKKTKSALKTALGVGTVLCNAYTKKTTGLSFIEFKQELESECESLLNDNNLLKLGNEIYKSYSFKHRSYTRLKNELEKYVMSLEKKPLIILVDELDRVRPNYAVKFLEAIKHLFSIQGICFVLAVDREQLEKSVKQLYGDIDFENYYRRFITREANLPYHKNITDFIEKLSDKFFDIELNYSFSPNDKPEILQYLKTITLSFNMLPRQVESLFRIISHFFLLNQNDSKTGKLTWIKASIFLVAIYITQEKKIYENIGNYSLSTDPDQLIYFIDKLNYSWITNDPDDIKKKLRRDALAFNLNHSNLEIIKNKANAIEISYEHILAYTDFNYTNLKQSILEQVYEKLESWKSFIE